MLLRLLFKGLKTPAYRQRISERLGFIDPISGSTIWLHCVSVGEFRAAIPLIDALIKQYPSHKILITSTTPTGSKAILEHYKNAVLHVYFPFDLPFIVKRYIQKIQPDLCLLLETEIWPNLINTLKKNNIPSLLVNARLSQRSLQKYQKFVPKLARKTLNNFTLITTQSQKSTQRFIELGVRKNKIITAGNIKFDLNPVADKAISDELSVLTGSRKVVVFASTHKGEEQKIIKAYNKNKIEALLIIVPRHPERFNEVYKLAQKHNIKIAKRSDKHYCADCEMLLGDSMGEMMSYFDIADVVFMGGSLVATGGHNMLEPAALSKPILFGKNVFNFAEIATDLLQKNGAIQVQTADALMTEISVLLDDSTKCDTLGKNANQYFKSQQGVVNNLMQQIQEIYK
ncbi:Lipid IVA 3-deoxy-D-manno-octulosonic acid transferase [often with also] [uncultured Candidatus Thioglobus sp.]|nr:Lipid IVA 3-deoxy-D-manno-octulosonic acid transferase [often with also] [uncultured Candidatus Thioglobus sp.]